MPKKKPEPKLLTLRVRPGVPADRERIRRLYLAANLTGAPASQIMRDAIDEKVKQISKQHPELAAA